MEELKFRRLTQRSTGGINTELLAEQSVNLHQTMLCNICFQIVNLPIQCKTCKKEYCSHCIAEWHKVNNNCPICKRKGVEDIDQGKKEKLNELLFKCHFFPKQCHKILKYSDFNNHVDNCDFAEFESTLIRCNFTGRLEEVKQHISECKCNTRSSKKQLLLKEMRMNDNIKEFEYSENKGAYNCINGIIFIEEYDYLVVGNSVGELSVWDVDENVLVHKRKGFKYVALLHYVSKCNLLIVGTVDGGFYGVRMTDFGEVFYIKTAHLFVDFISELEYPLVAVSDREDFITLINISEKQIEKKIEFPGNINKTIKWEEKDLLLIGTMTGNIIFYNYKSYSTVYTKENAHEFGKFLHCIEFDKNNKFLITGSYDGFIRKWSIQEDIFGFNLVMMFELNMSSKIIMGIMIEPESDIFYYLTMGTTISKANYTDGSLIANKPVKGSKVVCGFATIPEMSLIIIGDYKKPHLIAIDRNGFFE